MAVRFLTTEEEEETKKLRSNIVDIVK